MLVFGVVPKAALLVREFVVFEVEVAGCTGTSASLSSSSPSSWCLFVDASSSVLTPGVTLPAAL